MTQAIENEFPEETFEAPDLPNLAPQAYRFALNIAVKGMTQRAAFIDAYQAEHWKLTSVDAKASALRKNDKVSAWINHIRTAGAVLSRDEHLAELDRLKNVAIKMGNPSAAITAESLRGKVSRLYVDRVEISEAEAADPDELAKLAAGGDPAIEQALREKLKGVPRRVN